MDAQPVVHQCIHCKSTNLVFSDDKQGFGAGKALAGAMVFGPLGLLVGAIGKNRREVYVRCNSCLRVFDAKTMMQREKMRANPIGSGVRIAFSLLVLSMIFYALCSGK